jgi:N-acetylgalactosamine kinase
VVFSPFFSIFLWISRYKGFYEFAKSKGVDLGDAVGLDVIVDGTVPTGE